MARNTKRGRARRHRRRAQNAKKHLSLLTVAQVLSTLIRVGLFLLDRHGC